MRTVFMIEGAIDADAARTASSASRCRAARAAPRGRRRRRGDRGRRGLDCRYVGQGYELRIPLPGERFTPEALEEFHRLHEQEYGHAFRDPIEIVNLRVTAIGKRPTLERLPVAARNGGDPVLGEGESVFRRNGELHAVPDALLRAVAASGRRGFDGPAVVFQRDTTTVVPPGWTAARTPPAA